MNNHFTEDEVLEALCGTPVCRKSETRFYYLSFDGAKARNPFTVKIYTHGPVVGGVLTDGYLNAVVEADETNVLLLRLV